MTFQDGRHVCPISRLSFHCSVFKVRSRVKPEFQHLNFKCWNSCLTVISDKLNLFFEKILEGQSGLEPPTSRLSVVCSNQLSYWPILVEISGIEPLTSCLQSRRSPSWAKPPYLKVRGNSEEWRGFVLFLLITSTLSHSVKVRCEPQKLNNDTSSGSFHWLSSMLTGNMLVLPNISP